MRDKLMFALAAVCAAVLAVNFYKIFLILPDEANQGAIYRIVYVHVPRDRKSTRLNSSH
jgi:heme exporter protein C